LSFSIIVFMPEGYPDRSVWSTKKLEDFCLA
jgi:hypothetical protein